MSRPAYLSRGFRLAATCLAAAIVVTIGGLLVPHPVVKPIPSPPPGWLDEVGAALQHHEYEIRDGADGLQAPNRSLDIRTRFHPDGIAVEPRHATAGTPPLFAWRTESWGRADRRLPALIEGVEPRGSRAEYGFSGGLTEWYENRPGTLEQGWCVPSPPAGTGDLVIAGRLPDGSRIEARDDGGILDVCLPGADHAVRYADLHAFDATGRELSSRLVPGDRAIEIRVDDRGAVYPVTIDPSITPEWFFDPVDGGYTWHNLSFNTAGDVNGDGYSDVVIGVDDFDATFADEGAVFVFHGSPTGLPSAGGWHWAEYGGQSGARFGCSVSTAGDVDNDGHDDIVIGCALWDQGDYHPVDRGKASVYLGSGDGLADDPVWEVFGVHTNAWLGGRVACAGDVEGDGFSDVIISDCRYNGAPRQQNIYLYPGHAGGPAAQPTWTDSTVSYVEVFGTAGDVNGDLCDDVVVGDSQHDRARVFHGSPGGLAAAPAIVLVANYAAGYGQFGRAVGMAGDVNGDGYGDLIVGDPAYYEWIDEPPYHLFYGRVMIYHGSALGLPSQPSWDLLGPTPGQVGTNFGRAVATAGDVNGDGYADVMIGEPAVEQTAPDTEGRVFVHLGSAAGCSYEPDLVADALAGFTDYGIEVATAGDVDGDGFSDMLLSCLNPSLRARVYALMGAGRPPAEIAAFTDDGDGIDVHLGQWVAAAGDVDGDGFGDVLIGAPGYLGDRGKVIALSGSTSGLAPSSYWEYVGDATGAALGSCVAAAGDVDGDGYTDIIVGEPGRNSDTGRVLLFYGDDSGLNGAPDWWADGAHTQAQFGAAVAWAGDIDRDGYGDFIVGEPGFTDGEGAEGRARIYLGGPGGPTLSQWQFQTDQVNARFGFAVAGAGDIDRDGYSDVIVGAPNFTTTLSQQGRAYVFRGSSGGLDASPHRTIDGEQGIAFLGWSVAGAGDVNGDGYGDVVVGSPGYGASSGLPYGGRAYLYAGNDAGLHGSPSWMVTGFAPGVELGRSVASAGDVDGDGLSDIMVGSPGRTAAEIFLGAPGYPETTNAWEVQWSGGSGFGACVAMAGDVNGDGFGDVLVGAPDEESGQSGEGAFYLFLGNGRTMTDPALPVVARQRRPGLDPLDLLGDANSTNGVALSAEMGRSAFGRSRLRFEIRIGDMNTIPINCAVARSDWIPATSPGTHGSWRTFEHDVDGLAANTDHHWQVRVASDSPFFPHGPWYTVSRSAGYQKHFKTSGAQVLPNLRVVQIDPDVVDAGQPVTVSILVSNDGAAAAAATVTSLGLDGEVQCGSIATPALAPGGTALVTCDIGALAAGEHQLTACADAGGTLQESDETNNCRTEGLTATPLSLIVIVPDGGVSIQDAIDAIMPGGIIELTAGTHTGPGNRDLDFGGRALTLRGQGDGRTTCIVDCQGSAGDPHRAVYLHSGEGPDTVIENITFTGGHATSSGGAILLTGGSNPTIRDCVFLANHADNAGGAVTCSFSSPTVTGCRFEANDADNAGGAVSINTGSPVISDCWFEGNDAVWAAGGVYNNLGAPAVTDCVFLDNTCDHWGGALHDQGQDAGSVVLRCTFAGNAAPQGGAVYNRMHADTELDHCIIAFSGEGGAVFCDDDAGTVDLDCCDVYGNAGGDWTGCIADQAGQGGNLSADPLFCDLAGGDLSLRSESPCAEANNPGCGQIGAVGVACGLVRLVNPEGTGDHPTIQAALDAAGPGDVIELADGVYTGGGNRDLDTLGKIVTVRSQNGIPDNCVIDCQGSASEPHRGFYLHLGEGAGTIITDLTVTGGWSTGSGAGILITGGGTPTLEGCIFRDNHAGDAGGGVTCSFSGGIITNCRFEDNTADNAGGGLSINTGSPTVTGCWFVTNASVWGGGGVYNNTGTPFLEDCVFLANTCEHWGGGLHDQGEGAGTAMLGCTFSANAAPQGGALYNRVGATTTIYRTVVAFGTDGGAVFCDDDAGSVTFTCCDVYGNAGGDWTGCIADQAEANGNFSADPVFCDPESGDLTVGAASPCLPENNGCELLIGALGQGCSVPVGVAPDVVEIPADFALDRNYPNPFNPVTRIGFDLPRDERVELAVYGVNGRLVTMLVNEALPAGRHTALWSGCDGRGRPVASGPYFYRLRAGSFTATGRMLLVK